MFQDVRSITGSEVSTNLEAARAAGVRCVDLSVCTAPALARVTISYGALAGRIVGVFPYSNGNADAAYLAAYNFCRSENFVIQPNLTS